MKRILGIMLVVLLSCEEEIIPELRFSGQIKDGDLSPSVPIKNKKVKISYFADEAGFLAMDSTMTDNLGNYSVRKSNGNQKIKYYYVDIEDEYHTRCKGSSSITVIREFNFTKDVNELEINHDTIFVCQSGKIKLSLTKLNPIAKDTLTINSIIKTKTSTDIINQKINLSESRQWVYQYFTKTVKGVEYKFSLKKENGETTNWTKEIQIESGTTKELNIEY